MISLGKAKKEQVLAVIVLKKVNDLIKNEEANKFWKTNFDQKLEVENIDFFKAFFSEIIHKKDSTIKENFAIVKLYECVDKDVNGCVNLEECDYFFENNFKEEE